MNIAVKNGLTVGVFGFYSAMNFGDDLMALIICRHLESLNINYVLFSSTDIWKQYDINNTEFELEVFIDRVDIIIYGGGGILKPSLKQNNLPSNLSMQIGKLLDICKQKSIPVYGISVGGNGINIDEITPIQRQRLVLEADHLTFRNKQDFIRLKSNSKSGKFFHDIVWTTPRFFPSPKQSNTRKRIGINIYAPRKKAKMVEVIMKFIVKLRQECDFIFIDVSPKSSSRAFDLSLYNDNCSQISYSNLSKDVEFISSLDLLITSRLHIGVVAMSFGVPTISFLGRRKTKLLFQDIGLEHLVWERHGIYKLIWYFSTPKRLNSLTKIMDDFTPEPIIENSMNHFIELTKLVTN